MGNLSIDVKETLKKGQQISELNKKLEKDYCRLEDSFNRLGRSWRDEEYVKAKKYIEQAGLVVKAYEKSSEQFLEEVESKIRTLDKEYFEENTYSTTNLDSLGSLDLSSIEIEEKTEKFSFSKLTQEQINKLDEQISKFVKEGFFKNFKHGIQYIEDNKKVFEDMVNNGVVKLKLINGNWEIDIIYEAIKK